MPLLYKTVRSRGIPKEDTRLSERMFTFFIYASVVTFALFCFIPFWLVVIGSFTDERILSTQGYQMFPTDFSLYAYSYILKGKQFLYSYTVTTTVTVVGTVLAVLLQSSFAYFLSHRKVEYRNIFAFLTYFTILFGAGLVGFYLLISSWLGLRDTIWALILPYLLNPFYTFILVSFYRTIPFELNEAATIDGANEIHTFFRIIWPVAVPAIATIALFNALHYWNDWFLALLFIDDYKLHPLQIMIRQLISSVDLTSYLSEDFYSSETRALPSYGVRLATVTLTIGPIVFLYPFIQKFFIKGLTIGSLKG